MCSVIPVKRYYSVLLHIMLLLLLVNMVWLSGCYRVWTSHGQITDDSQWRSEVAGVGTFLYGPDIRILVKTKNNVYPFRKDSSDEPFWISLAFDPKRPNFKLNPNEIFLRMPNGGELKPAQIVAKLASHDPRAADWSCGPYPIVMIELGPAYNLKRGFCVELSFPIKAPSPQTPFSMRINGITLESTAVVVPKIHFQGGSFLIMDLP